MKTYQNFGIYDFSDYAEEITGAALFKINGGAQVENSNEGVAGAQVGDTIIRNDGTEVTLTQGDITWAQEQVGAGDNSGNTGSTGVNSQGSTNSNYQGSSSGQTGGEEKHQNEETSYNYNPNEPDSDKRYNAKDYDGKHLMTIRYDDKENFEDFAGYYTIIGQYGAAGTTVYDGIGLTDKKGNIIQVLKDEGSIKKYAEYLNPSYEHNIYSPLNHDKNPRYNPNLNSDYIENNQLKSDREVYLETETSRYGFTGEVGLAKGSSKTLTEGPAGNVEVNLVTANASWMNSPEYKKIGAGVNLISVDGEVGFQIGDTRFTIGAGLGLGLNFGFTKIQNSLYVDLGPLKGIHFTFEKD